MAESELAIAALAAVAAGFVNALAGGGTLISFPVLVALGVPPIAANVTNAVALAPGYFGAALAQLPHLKGQRQRLWLLLPAAILGGLVGGMILLATRERLFEALVPYMILLAALLLGVQERLRRAIVRRLQDPRHVGHAPAWALAPMMVAAVYGGFFTAGMSVILVAVLGLVLDDTLTRLNALKQILALAVSVTAAVYFLFSDQVLWAAAVVMAVGALLGGALGGRLAGHLKPAVLRWTIVVLGVLVALAYGARA
ncbi:MAG: sulfite exporter TauE/SafE family protein [Proteobacteria bacterium]|nr:MAG: sulfite exporter TauE/SafE family protein [Pseudomonadota bacterium]